MAFIFQTSKVKARRGTINQPPVLTSVPQSPVTVPSIGGTLQFTATDPDGDELTYSLTTTRDGITINQTTGLVSVASSAAGTNGNIVVQVSDGISTASTTVDVRVESAQGTTVSPAALRAAGYILPEDYGAVGNGVTNDGPAIQAAIDAAYVGFKTVWFSSKTYVTAQTLRCYRWQRTESGSPPAQTHQLVGASYPSRPIIKLAASASGFGNASAPRPVIVFAQWKPSTPGATGALPPTDLTSWNPYTSLPPPGNAGPWVSNVGNLFDQVFSGIDIDTNANAGADGLSMLTAQNSYLGDCKVTATGSVCGIRGLPGRNSNARNVEVVGGQIGVSTEVFLLGACAGAVVSGLVCTGQTSKCVELTDFVPAVFVGFRFSRASGGPLVTFAQSSSTASNGACFIDGQVETASGIAFDNTSQVGLYLRNVYVGNGTTSLAKTGGTTLSGSGAWSRIDEYCANRMGGTFVSPGAASTGSTSLQHFELIDGAAPTRVSLPVVSKTDNSGAPPSDIVSRHLYNGIPVLDGGPYINITAAPYNAVATVGVDNRAAIQAAIDAAAAAGHNRVFIPKGTFEVGSPGLVLGANTKLFGTGIAGDRSTIYSHASWVPPDGITPPIVSTVDSAGGTAFLGFLQVLARDKASPRSHFNNVKWMVGRNSATACIQYEGDFVSYEDGNGNPINPVSTTPTFRLWITGNGGGRHYGYNTDTIGLGGVDSRGLKITGTTEPLHVYGVNSESVKRTTENSTTGYMRTNVEVTSANNVRLYSMKREGNAPSVIITDSNNVAVYGGGGMRSDAINYNQVLGNSGGILMAQLLVQNHNRTAGGFIVYENVTNGGGIKSIGWPNGCSLYKRGTLNDAAVNI